MQPTHPDPDLRARLQALDFEPPLGKDNLPVEGSTYGPAQVVKVRSRGPGVPVPARNPLGRRPRRISGWSSADVAGLDLTRSKAREITVIPQAPRGADLTLLVE